MNQPYKLPIGIQVFRDLREEDYLYVDKTEFVHRLATEGKFYFLSRPRRFGKSLLLSTLKELFLGSKELFHGLWIENRWDWTKKNPVVHISFAGTGYAEIGLDKAMLEIIGRIARQHGLALSSGSYAARFRELLEILHARDGKVVVLIDEYDKPIIDYLENTDIAAINRNILREFYVVLKDAQEYLRFVFITGISRFSKVSIFSALNHLDDISMDKRFATSCGYTQAELTGVFSDYLAKTADQMEMTMPELLAEMKRWYNGYSWDGETSLYNPFCILLFLKNEAFGKYWFLSGTPDLLAQIARREQLYDLDVVETTFEAFESFDVESLNLQALLFQTGYLTVKSFDRRTGSYVLGYPNFEVRSAFLTFLVGEYTSISREKVTPLIIKLENAFLKDDLQQAVSLINTLLSGVPHHIFDGANEAYFHSLVHVIFSLLGSFIESEVNTSAGRIDSVVQTAGFVYILEFKLNASAQVALDQIIDRNYAQKYRHLEKTIIGVGINFSGKRKEIEEWIQATL